MDAAPINIADVVIVLVLAVSGIFALFRGFVHEMLSVVSWIGAALATLYAFPYLQPHLRALITVPLIADMVAGVAIFLLVLIVLSVLTHLISHRIRASALGPLDRSLGLLYGFARGAVIVCVAWLIFAWLLPEREDHPEWITEAKARPLVERGGAMIVSLLPPRLRGELGAKAEAAASEAERLREESYRTLLNPPAKADAPTGEPGYNSRMREDMRRAIEGVTGSKEGSR